MHLRVWKFRPPAARELEFAHVYSSNGRWAELFRQSEGFRGTTLLRPLESHGWWLTIDRWDSHRAFELFQRERRSAYRALDSELEPIAGEQEFVGAFEEAD